MNKKNPHRIDPADKAKGDRAELRFRRWLDADVLPHLYIDQTPMSVPAPMRGQIKRPDYIVGVPGVGAVAFDVISKSRGKPSFIGMIMNAFRPKPTTPTVLSQSSPTVDAEAATPVAAGSAAEPRRAASKPKGDADTD